MNPTTNPKRYLQVLATATLTLFVAVASFNAWIDPMWIFDHSHAFNRLQVQTNQRVQKLNYLNFGDRAYDSVLIGSSRCVALVESDFKGMSLFNFSLNSIHPDEYESVIGVFTELKGPPKNIFIGMDFWSSGPRPDRYPRLDPEAFLRDARSPLYVLKTLLSLDTVGFSIQNLRLNLDPTREEYQSDRNNRLTIVPVSPANRSKHLRRQVVGFRKSYYESSYVYQTFGSGVLRRIQKRYPDAKLTVFISPIPLELYREFLVADRFDDYARWIGDLVGTGAIVIDMMGINELTSAPSSFHDEQHLQSAKAGLVAEVIQNGGKGRIGIQVTRENLGEHIAARRRDIAALEPSNGF